MNCLKPILLRGPELPYLGLEVPCGKCLACRIQKRKEWTLRMTHELSYHEDSSFITLTYSNENLPLNASLKKSDLQKFFKRLRKKRSFRYFATGEYGDDTQRPHYHIILFGIEPNRKLLEETWTFGNIHIGLAEPKSIEYVAGYIHSKLSGDEAEKKYNDTGREPVFNICSKGIGRQYADDYLDQYYENEKITLKGIPYSIPRYYLKRTGVPTLKFRKKSQEHERELHEKLFNIYATLDEMYEHHIKPKDFYPKKGKIKIQHDANLKAKLNLKKSKI